MTLVSMSKGRWCDRHAFHMSVIAAWSAVMNFIVSLAFTPNHTELETRSNHSAAMQSRAQSQVDRHGLARKQSLNMSSVA